MKPNQIAITTAIIAAAIILTAVISTASLTAAAAGGGAEPGNAAQIARGKYLVDIMGCHDCHTPMKMGPQGPERDWDRALSGHPEYVVMPPAPALPPGPWISTVGATFTAWNGPWGTSFTMNLTPDKDTGIGGFSDQQIFNALRYGLRPSDTPDVKITSTKPGQMSTCWRLSRRALATC